MEVRRPWEPLPVELQLEIVAHSDDAATIIRCGAASKTLRRAILSPAFRPCRRLALRAAANAGFDLALLLGVSDDGGKGIAQPPSRQRQKLQRFDTSLLRSFEPVSSRDGLLVLGRRRPEPELCVCDTATGHVTSLPCMDVERKWGAGGIYHPALLTIDGPSRSFELLVMDACMRARIFSSNDGKWGAIRVVKPPPDHNSWCIIKQAAMDASPTVIGRNVHWICCSTRSVGDTFILARHTDSAQATSIELPQACLGSTGSCVLAATANGQLCAIVPETGVISMWTLLAEGWSREVVISKHRLSEQIALGLDAVSWKIWFVGFGERSAMIFGMERVGLVQIELGTNKATVCSELDTTGGARVGLHEIDLVSLLHP